MQLYESKILSGKFYKTLLDCLFDAVYTVDNEGCIIYWNESCERITGYSSEEILGQQYNIGPLVFAEDPETQIPDEEVSDESSVNSDTGRDSGIQIVLETGMPGTWKGYVRRKNGQRIPIESHISPIRDAEGTITGAVEVFRDISVRVALEDAHRQVLQMSRKDLLTALFNRAAINELLKTEIERSSRYDQPLSVIMMDIDLFKRINDRYGHDVGDKVLAKMGAILQHNLRKPDTAGRWGGEEFLIVAPGSDNISAAQLAERLRQYIKDIPQGQVPEPITASFGVSQLQRNQGIDKLIYVADMALYRAKNSGRDKVIVGSA